MKILKQMQGQQKKKEKIDINELEEELDHMTPEHDFNKLQKINYLKDINKGGGDQDPKEDLLDDYEDD